MAQKKDAGGRLEFIRGNYLSICMDLSDLDAGSCQRGHAGAIAYFGLWSDSTWVW